jgi:Uma2 family endonuclease
MVACSGHRFSVKEYYRMAETGILPPDARVELLDGQVIDKSRITPPHGGVSKFLIHFFSSAVGHRSIISVQNPVRLDDYWEPEPDLMLLKPVKDFYKTAHPPAEDALLILEISDTTLEKDQEIKLPAYARAGVSEVWIENLNEQTIEVYRQPHFSGDGSRVILSAGDKASPQAFPDVSLDVAELLKR